MTKATPASRKFSIDECRAVVQQMWPYLDSVLSERDGDPVAQHVATCSACQQHFVFAQSFLHAVRLAHGASPDFSVLEEKVVAALAAVRWAGEILDDLKAAIVQAFTNIKLNTTYRIVENVNRLEELKVDHFKF